MEDLFETAVHSVHDAAAMKRLWLEYLAYLKAQVSVSGGTYQHFKVSQCVMILDQGHCACNNAA